MCAVLPFPSHFQKYMRDVKLLERVQKRAIKMTKDLEPLSCREGLRAGLFSCEERLSETAETVLPTDAQG